MMAASSRRTLIMLPRTRISTGSAQRCDADHFEFGAGRGAEHQETTAVFGLFLSEGDDPAAGAGREFLEKQESGSFF